MLRAFHRRFSTEVPRVLSASELAYLESRVASIKSAEDLQALMQESGVEQSISAVYTLPLSINPDVWKGYKGPEYTTEYQKAMLANVMESVNAPAEDADGREITSLTSIIKKYGVFPFVGFLGAIVCGKEYYVLDSHTMLAVYFMLNVTGIWLFAGPSMWSSYVEHTKKDMQWWNDYNQMCVEAAKMDIQGSTTLLNTPAVLKEAKSEFNEVAKKLFDSKNLAMKRHFREEMIAKLESIQKRENDQAAEVARKQKEEAFDQVIKNFSESSADQDLYLYMVLKELSAGPLETMPMDQHPILRHLNDYLKQNAKK